MVGKKLGPWEHVLDGAMGTPATGTSLSDCHTLPPW